MKTNFTIEDNYAVIKDGIQIDLHNNFDYKGFVDNVSDFKIEFVKMNGNWIKENEFSRLIFNFKDVSYRFLGDGDSEANQEDKVTLGEISFFPQDLRDVNDSIIPQAEPKENDDLIFIFEDGKVIRLSCDFVELITIE
ncbi:hypothetical protein [Aureispira sp. CCB-E]|uniref:hypothetical protein n=1 Tax=Aureispira sp. CCB-E TaxID=3051121 RepID=UPI0028690B78|nr:hypothetical protein [Aureispira sp. CCB-E]WMX13133.1 hypothetical protein QP953_20025 [Aureispira sp. CCB-E]